MCLSVGWRTQLLASRASELGALQLCGLPNSAVPTRPCSMECAADQGPRRGLHPGPIWPLRETARRLLPGARADFERTPPGSLRQGPLRALAGSDHLPACATICSRVVEPEAGSVRQAWPCCARADGALGGGDERRGPVLCPGCGSAAAEAARARAGRSTQGEGSKWCCAAAALGVRLIATPPDESD